MGLPPWIRPGYGWPVPETGLITHSLHTLPADVILRSVTATPGHAGGRDALQVSLVDEVARYGRMGVDYVDQPTFVVIPADLTIGSIEVDILSRLTATAPEYARAFAGVAYHVTNGGNRFEAVYLRPFNGRRISPPSPRDQRAIQYFVYPEWPFDRLREVYPDGRFETGADIGPDEWTHLHLQIEPTRVIVSVNGRRLLVVNQTLSAAVAGAIGLWVDIGTEAYFANLAISPAG